MIIHSEALNFNENNLKKNQRSKLIHSPPLKLLKRSPEKNTGSEEFTYL